MATSRTYIVSFSPAEKQAWGGYTIALSTLIGGMKHTVVAASLDALEAEVNRMAQEYGRTCSPYVRLPRGERKPPGFDRWYAGMKIIEVAPATADA